MTVVERLEARRIIRDGCWLYKGYVRRDGYAVLTVAVDGRPTARYVHRLMYKAMVGPIPPGMHLDHLCRVRHCMNPSHLEAVPPAENYRRGHSVPAQNGRKTHCKHGHPFDELNTHYRPGGGRTCRICERAKTRRQQARRKAAA